MLLEIYDGQDAIREERIASVDLERIMGDRFASHFALLFREAEWIGRSPVVCKLTLTAEDCKQLAEMLLGRVKIPRAGGHYVLKKGGIG